MNANMFIAVGSVEEALTKLNLESAKQQSSTALANPCESQANRTFELKITNTSDWTIITMFVQLKSSLPVPLGYTSDTGVFAVALGLVPNGSEISDPCTVGGHNNKAILATYWEYAVKCFIEWNGKRYEQDLYMKCKTPAPAGKYWPKLPLGIKRSASIFNNNLPGVELKEVSEKFEPLQF